MADNPNLGATTMGVRVLADAYLAWLWAEAESEIALCGWSKAVGPTRARAYAAYRTALDREDAAALELERQACRSEPGQRKSVFGGAAPCS